MRPPRSYAEMEGLQEATTYALCNDEPATGHLTQATAEPYRHWREIVEHRELRAVHRWLTGVFFAVLGMIAMLFVLVLVVTAEV